MSVYNTEIKIKWKKWSETEPDKYKEPFLVLRSKNNNKVDFSYVLQKGKSIISGKDFYFSNDDELYVPYTTLNDVNYWIYLYELNLEKMDINFTGLEQELSKMFNDINVKITYELIRPVIVHDPILDQIGCFKHCLKQASIDFFSFTKKDADADNYWWCTIHLNYESNKGGCNGMQILEAYYDHFKQKWNFQK